MPRWAAFLSPVKSSFSNSLDKFNFSLKVLEIYKDYREKKYTLQVLLSQNLIKNENKIRVLYEKVNEKVFKLLLLIPTI